MKKLVFLLSLAIIGCSTKEQNKVNLSSIEYKKFELPKDLEETSGIILNNGLLWTHNDSGNESVVFNIDATGEIIQKIPITTAKNIDWEDITAKNEFITIGDFGNNFGTRKNLYLLELKFINGKLNKHDSIPFYYPEQTSYLFNALTPFDAEAIINIENKYLVFTKNRNTLTTEMYLIDKTLNRPVEAEYIESLNVNSLITGGDYNEDSKTLVLTSYSSGGYQYLIRIKNFSLQTLENIEIENYGIDYKDAQIEAITIINENEFWITSEETDSFEPFLAKIKIN